MNGVNAKAGYVDAAAFDTVWSPVTTQIPITDESLSKAFDMMRSKALDGNVAQKEFSLGRQIVQGDLSVEMDYDNHGLLHYCFGSGSATYEFDDDNDNWFHLEIDKYTKRHRFYAVGVNSWTISGEAGSEDPLKLALGCYTRSQLRADTAFPSLSLADNRIYFEDLSICYVGDQADALGAGDAVAIKGFELSCENNFQIDGKDSSDQDHVLAHARNDWRSASLKLQFARYGADQEQFATWRDAGTRLQATMIFTNGSDSMTVYVPEMKISAGADFSIGGPNVTEGEVTMDAFYNNNNTPMSTVADQAEIVFV